MVEQDGKLPTFIQKILNVLYDGLFNPKFFNLINLVTNLFERVK